MSKRFVSIWFRYLLTDWKTVRNKSLKAVPLAFTQPDHGRLLIITENSLAGKHGVRPGMTAADAKVIAPGLLLFEDKPGHHLKLLRHLAEWFLRLWALKSMDAL